jgi:hypothetical protein
MQSKQLSTRQATRMAGALFLAAMAAYASGNILLDSAMNQPDYLSTLYENRARYAAGPFIMLLNSAAVLGIGVLLLPILEPHHKAIAYGYLGARLFESILLAAGIVFLLMQIPLSWRYTGADGADGAYHATLSALLNRGNYYAYQIAMVALGVGSLFFCRLLLAAKLVPGPLAWWGALGYAALLTGAILDIFGFDIGLLFALPGGLFEVFFGVWLMVKGFRHADT